MSVSIYIHRVVLSSYLSEYIQTDVSDLSVDIQTDVSEHIYTEVYSLREYTSILHRYSYILPFVLDLLYKEQVLL